MKRRSQTSLGQSAEDPTAFASFYDEHASALLAYVTRRVCDADVGLDLMAETFAQAYAGRARFRGTSDGEAAAWLYKIADRQVARYFRRHKVEQRAMRRLGLERPELDDAERVRIEELAGLQELRGHMSAALEQLSAEQRAALKLRVVDELTYPEVADHLSISEQAARARVSRGLKALAAATKLRAGLEGAK